MENNNINLQNQDNYSKKSDKVIDFLIGYFGFFIIGFILYYLVFFGVSVSAINSSMSGLIGFVFILFPIVALIFANVVLKKKRRYMAKGVNFALLTLTLIPVLLFGACLISLKNI